jgi:hypothetical protein
MVILLEREPNEFNTPGQLFINDMKFCDTLEDKDRGLMQNTPIEQSREIKVHGETCIPYGTYQVRMTYSPKFSRMMPEVMNVTNFSGIRFHSVRDDRDTEGCIGLVKRDEAGVLRGNPKYTKDFTTLCADADMRSEYIEITIRKKK